jgi:hypothetical protein
LCKDLVQAEATMTKVVVSTKHKSKNCFEFSLIPNYSSLSLSDTPTQHFIHSFVDLIFFFLLFEKERKKYVKLRKMQDACQEELHRAQQQNSSSLPKVSFSSQLCYYLLLFTLLTSFHSFFFVQVQKKLEDTIKKADKADTDYSNAVNNLKTMQDRFYDSEMPQILKVLSCDHDDVLHCVE